MRTKSGKRRARRSTRARTTTVGVALIVVGLAVLGFLGWQFIGTNAVSRHRAAEIRKETESAWAHDKDGPAGAILRVPRFGKDYQVPIIRGFDEQTLARGIAWYPQSAEPGEIGNYVLAAHRITQGEPFSRFPDLRAGDLVSVETRTATYTYELRSAGTATTVNFHATWPLWPVPAPDAAGRKPTEAVITLLTCSELFHTDNRNVVVGDLVTTLTQRR